MKGKAILLFTAVVLAALPLFAPTAVESYMLLVNANGTVLTGESKDAAHLGWIEIQSFSFGLPQTSGGANTIGGASRAGEEKVAVHDISITKVVDKASPALFNAAVAGTHFKSATIEVHGQRFLLEDVMVSSVQKSGAMGDGSVRETIKLNFARDVTHGSPVGTDNPAIKKTEVKIDYKNLTNATIGGTGGAPASVMLRSLHVIAPAAGNPQMKYSGQNQAIIVVCDVAGTGALTGLQRAFYGKQTLPVLTFSALSGNSTQKQYLNYRFEGILVSSYNPAPGAPAGCAQISLNFTKYDGPLAGFDWVK